MKVIASLSVLVAALVVPLIAAAQAQDRGFYAGASIGQMKAQGDCDPGFSCDLTDTAWKLFVGYRVNRNFAVEGTYGDWGSIKLNTTVLGIPVSGGGDISSWGIAAVGILPVAERVELFGKAGIALTKQTVRASGGGVSASDSNDETELHYGLGAVFNVTRQLGVRAEWERLHDSEVNIISIGVQYRF